MSSDDQRIFFTVLSWVLYLPLPAFFLLSLWRHKGTQFWPWLLQATLCGAYILFIFLIGAWPLVWGYWVREILILGFAVVAIKSLLNMRKTYRVQYRGLIPLLSSLFKVGILVLLLRGASEALLGARLPPHSVALSYPLRSGCFCVVQGGNSEVINHHYSVPAQKFAIDLVQISPWGLSSHGLTHNKLDDYVIFGASLYSPCTGLVLEAVDIYQDMIPGTMDSQHPAGNYVTIAMEGSNVVVLMAHLQRNSLRVRVGDRVTTGQCIARVGNSGNTSEPHLHIHAVLQGTGDVLFTGTGIPITFDAHFLVRNTCAIVSEQGDMHFLGF